MPFQNRHRQRLRWTSSTFSQSRINQNEKTDLDLLLEDFRNKSQISKPDMDLLDFASIHYDEKSFRRVEQTIRGTKRNLKTSFIVNFSETEGRIDPHYYFFKYQAFDLISKFEPLSKKIKERSEKFLPQSDEELDKEYAILSVTNNEGVILNEYRRGEEFTQSYKKVKSGDIVYNPYRINVGSIGVVPLELDGGFVSPAYVVFKSLDFEPDFLVEFIKSPFYKMYIDVISTGSIRDSLSLDILKSMKFPKVDKETQTKIFSLIKSEKTEIQSLNGNINNKKEEIINELHNLIQSK